MRLKHTDGAIDSIAMTDIPGDFITKNGDIEMWVVLKECSYDKLHIFNLLSMSRLLHKKGWKQCIGIYIPDGTSRLSNFDAVVLTEEWEVYAYKFVCSTEVAMADLYLGV